VHTIQWVIASLRSSFRTPSDALFSVGGGAEIPNFTDRALSMPSVYRVLCREGLDQPGPPTLRDQKSQALSRSGGRPKNPCKSPLRLPRLENALVSPQQIRPDHDIAPATPAAEGRVNSGRGHQTIGLCEVRSATDRHLSPPTKKPRTAIRTGAPSDSLTNPRKKPCAFKPARLLAPRAALRCAHHVPELLQRVRRDIALPRDNDLHAIPLTKPHLFTADGRGRRDAARTAARITPF